MESSDCDDSVQYRGVGQQGFAQVQGACWLVSCASSCMDSGLLLVCTCACIPACVDVCMHVCMHARMHVCM
jgi:hypothetical protein